MLIKAHLVEGGGVRHLNYSLPNGSVLAVLVSLCTLPTFISKRPESCLFLRYYSRTQRKGPGKNGNHDVDDYLNRNNEIEKSFVYSALQQYYSIRIIAHQPFVN